jgi:uncharacterized protein (TIGR03000 family)
VIRWIAGALGALTVLFAPVAPAHAENSRWTLGPPVHVHSGFHHGFYSYPFFGGYFPYPNYVSVYYGGPAYYNTYNVTPAYGAPMPAAGEGRPNIENIPAPKPADAPKIEDIPAPKPVPAEPKIEDIPAPKPTTQNGGVAEIDLTVPTDANVWFQGIRIKQTGPVRMLVTPPLKTGRSYSYEIRATYMENGREVTTVRNLSVRAGDRLEALLIALPVASSSSTTVTSGQ